MSTKDIHENHEPAPPLGLGSSEGLGLAPERAIVAYLYHDAATPEDAHPWLHSTMLVLAADRRPGLRGETGLVTEAQLLAAVAAEREHMAELEALAKHETDCAEAYRAEADALKCELAAEREARREAQRRLEAAQEAAIRHQRDMARAVAEERERTSGAVALAAEYDAWMRYHDAGNGDFRDFLRQLPSPGA
jgi:hypothetical protein